MRSLILVAALTTTIHAAPTPAEVDAKLHSIETFPTIKRTFVKLDDPAPKAVTFTQHFSAGYESFDAAFAPTIKLQQFTIVTEAGACTVPVVASLYLAPYGTHPAHVAEIDTSQCGGEPAAFAIEGAPPIRGAMTREQNPDRMSVEWVESKFGVKLERDANHEPQLWSASLPLSKATVYNVSLADKSRFMILSNDARVKGGFAIAELLWAGKYFVITRDDQWKLHAIDPL